MFDDTHQKRVDTSLENNPTSETICDVDVYHVFRRNKTGDKDRDGNPLIYAMKGMNGYGIVPMYRQMFFRRADEIIATIAGKFEADFVMPIPSSYGFCGEVAERVSNAMGVPLLASNFILKKTIGEVLAQYGELVPDDLKPKARQEYKSQLAVWRRMDEHRHVSMKEIDNSIRRCFQHLKISDDPPDIAGRKIVVVDDLMSTGTSLISTFELLRSAGAVVSGGVCFLSGL